MAYYDFYSSIVDEADKMLMKQYLMDVPGRGWIWFTIGGTMIPTGFVHLHYNDRPFESPRGYEIDCPFGRFSEECHYLDQIDRFAKDAGFKVFATGPWNKLSKLVAPTEADAVLLSGFVTVLQHERAGIG